MKPKITRRTPSPYTWAIGAQAATQKNVVNGRKRNPRNASPSLSRAREMRSEEVQVRKRANRRMAAPTGTMKHVL